ncbi:AraC family transcriptional regulator [Tenacibaculum skagerrakense]|uniref:AraC family transcriptional regulator n=1 Tax=Tenacibaculum skagerrakense TaxID=186571 RepID=A0A4R2P076_9FLAO|nr:GyrI-like domain-containing protein [Tenacibaculum skagerrakense]TCP27902.1 AraC family transcriptional regulator [Tenacibaculum skagerrakense]
METKEFYKKRLQQVVSYIRIQYNHKILIEELEHLSSFSYRNLQRVFKAFYNETIGAYVTRLKVENAAKKLVYSPKEIKLIAEEVGYSDVFSFSKAFKKHFGISPSKFRDKKEELFKKNEEITEEIMPFIEKKITVLPKKRVLYTTFKGDYYSTDLNTVWDDFIEKSEGIGIDVDSAESFGVIWDEPTISEILSYHYDACLVIDDLELANSKFSIKTIPAETYAVFEHLGSYKTIVNTYDKIFSKWLFTTNHEIIEKPFLEFYILHEGNTTNENDYKTEIFIPIKG